MFNQNTFDALNIPGKNVLKDNSEKKVTDIFSSIQPDYEINNQIINSNLDNGNMIK